MKAIFLAAGLIVALPLLARSQVAILHIQVTEGEGAVNLAGARLSRPLAVEITDETGKPVEGAAVSFHLPEEGPGGAFGNGLRTDVVLTDARGRAVLRALQLNRTPGRFEIRIVAAKEQARAGMVSFQYIAGPASPKSGKSLTRGPLKWIALGVLASAAAAAGALAAARSGALAPAPASTAATSGTISIGSPTLTVGKP